MSAPDAGASGAPGGEGPAVLELSRVRKTFRAGGRTIEALRDVSLKARAGWITGLIGPDAAGKTTLMRLAVGLLVPDAGEIRVLGIDATRESLQVHSAVGYMPQRFGLYDDLTVQENLDLYADLQGVPPNARGERYAELMHMTGLGAFTRRLAGRLSGGMKQKLGLACTLVRSPRLLLLDEPTVGVDPVSRRELWAIVGRLVRDEGTSVLLSTAYLDEADRCDDVIMIHEGRGPGQASPAEFKRQVEGRAYAVSAPGMGKRRLQEILSRAPGLVDAVIQADRVRVVTAEPGPPDLKAALPAGAEVSAVSPRFEDSFVATLGKRRGDVKPPGPALVEAEAAAGHGESVIMVRDLERRFGDFYAVKGNLFRGGARGGFRPAGGKRRGEVHDLPHVVRAASADRRPLERGGGGLAPGRACREGAHRLHVSEVLAVRQPERAAEPGLFQQRLQPFRGAAGGPHRLGARTVRAGAFRRGQQH